MIDKSGEGNSQQNDSLEPGQPTGSEYIERAIREGVDGKFQVQDGIGKLTLNDLDIEVEFEAPGLTEGAAERIRRYAIGPRPDSGAGDAYAWYEGDIGIAQRQQSQPDAD